MTLNLTEGRSSPHQSPYRGVASTGPQPAPAFRLGSCISPSLLLYVDHGRYGLSACELREKGDFADALYKRGQLTWNELQSALRHGLGSEKLPQHNIRTGIPKRITPDENFLAFRFSGRKAMVGCRQGQIFYVVWLDRDFRLHDHGS